MSAVDIRLAALELAVVYDGTVNLEANALKFERYLTTGSFEKPVDEEPEIDNTSEQSTSKFVDLDKKTNKRSRRKG